MFSHTDLIYANRLEVQTVDTNNFDIVNPKGEILLNGVAPGGSGGSLPIIGTGDIQVQGNIRAQGDGVSTGKLEGVIIKATSGNIIASAGNVEVLSGNVEISGTGGLEVNGTGAINVGTGGVTSVGDIQTSSGDIVSAGNIFFDGNDIYHRTNNPSAQTSYVTYKQLPQLNASNTFTGANKFDSNVNEFSKRISVGERDAGGLFTQKTAINPSGNIECVSLNNGTAITCGTITCDNGGVNSCAAKTFTTRTSGPAGWTIEQQPVEGNQLDNVLQIQGGQPGAYVTITNSGFAGFVPNIIFDPQTEVEGGRIVTDNYTIGDSNPHMFALKQPKTGVDSNNLIIQGSALDGSIKFQNFAGTTDLVKIESDSTDGSGRIYCPALFFGTTGIHNSIVNDSSGPDILLLKIRQATANSEVTFLDNEDTEVLTVKKTQVELGNTIPLHFGNFSFRPQQFYKDIIGFSFNHAVIGATNLLFNTGAVGGNPVPNDWTNVNTGLGNQSVDLINNPGAYKITIRQISAGTLSQINGMRVMSDIVLSRPNDNAPDIELSQPTAYSYTGYDGEAPIITMIPAFLSWGVHCTFPNTSGNETANIRVTLTHMPYFA